MKTLTVMLACNNEHGNNTGTFHMLTVEDQDGQVVVQAECDDDDAVACVFDQEGRVRLWRRRFHYKARGRMVGNVFWDSITVPATTAARILTYILGNPDDRFVITEATGLIYDKLDRGERLTAGDLEEP